MLWFLSSFSLFLSYQSFRITRKIDTVISIKVFYESLKVLVAQSCPTLCHLMDCSPPGSSVHGILQARILEWVAMPFSRGFSTPRDRTQVSCIAGRSFTIWASREAQTCSINLKYFQGAFFFFNIKQGESLCDLTIYIYIFFFFLFLNVSIYLTELGISCSTWNLSCGMQDLFRCSMWDPVPWPRIKLGPPAGGAQSLSHWTTRQGSPNNRYVNLH